MKNIKTYRVSLVYLSETEEQITDKSNVRFLKKSRSQEVKSTFFRVIFPSPETITARELFDYLSICLIYFKLKDILQQ